MAVISKSRAEQLGAKLATESLAPGERRELEEFRASYVLPMAHVQVKLIELGLECTTRLKNLGTVAEKLRREEGMALPRVQDIAGVRVVVADLGQQDEVVDQIPGAWRGCRVRDRREEPSPGGYRAVHLIVKQDDRPVEVQVRTALQHQWAEVFEKMGDRWGRSIRYNGPPAWRGDEQEFQGALVVLRQMEDLSDVVLSLERATWDYQRTGLEDRDVKQRIDDLRRMMLATLEDVRHIATL